MRQGSCEVTYAITHKPIKNVGCVHFANKKDMEYAIENDVGLSPDNPHIIYAESGTGKY